MPIQRQHPADLRQRLNDSLASATPAEAAVAAHFLNHLEALPFETAASVARRIGVSEATVGRYCRAIGYPHFKGLKAALQREMGGPRMADRAAVARFCGSRCHAERTAFRRPAE